MCMCIMCIKMFNIYTIFSDLQIDLIFLNLRLKVLNIYLCNMGRPQKKKRATGGATEIRPVGP